LLKKRANLMNIRKRRKSKFVVLLFERLISIEEIGLGAGGAPLALGKENPDLSETANETPNYFCG